MSATETSGCEVRKSEIHGPRLYFSNFLHFSKIKIFWKWLYWDVQYYISGSCLLGWILPLETQYPWEILRTRNHGAWVQKMIGRMAQGGFHQRICVQVKHLIPVLAGHISPYINVAWMLSHSKVRLINHISFTFRLSLKKKWENVHILKPGLRYFCYYCAARAECRLPDTVKGWL